MKMINDKTSVALLCLLAAACVRPVKGVFGIPDFLELGLCLNATLKDGFDPVKYQGLWFSIQSVPNEYEHSRQCNFNNYTWQGDRMLSVGKGVNDEGVKIKQITELLEEWELREPPHPAYLTVSAAGVPESPYEIIATDYVTYSCVHSCLEYFGFKAEFFWVFGRTPYLSRDYVTLCHDAFTGMGIDPGKLVDISHGESCPYTEKLGDMLEKNRKLMINLGVLDEGAPLLPSKPLPTVPPTASQDTRNEVQEDVVSVKVNSKVDAAMSPRDDDETFLEDPIPASSPPLKTSNIVIPLFILVAVLLPAVAR